MGVDGGFEVLQVLGGTREDIAEGMAGYAWDQAES